jgi:ubiquitin carboxyl-terminal hydrolase L3
MNSYIEKMGVDITALKFCEVLSMEDWAFDMVPRPCLGIVMLYPIKAASEAYADARAARIAAEGQVVSPNLRYIKQKIGNACGTIGILHALSNLWDKSHLKVQPGSYFAQFCEDTKDMNGDQIADYLDSEEGGDELEACHQEACAEGDTELPAEDEPVMTHFIAFSIQDGCLYELDGRNDGPINHGACESDQLLEKATGVVKAYMDRDPGELRFTVVALTKPMPDEDADE